MPSNEGHIHWDGSMDSTVNHLGQELQLTSGDVSDPVGAVRIRLSGSQEAGLVLPSDGWEPIPGTDPVLQARHDGHYAVDYIRIRQA